MSDEPPAWCARIAVVLNPASGRGRGARSRSEIERLLRLRGGEWEIIETQRPGGGRAAAAAAVDRGAALVVAAGGDGTLGETLNGIMGSPAALGLIPIGTGNDFARHIGIDRRMERAIDTLYTGEVRQVDAGRAGDRWFLNVAGSGFDAVVAECAGTRFRGLGGAAAYVAAVLRTLPRFRAAPMRITLDERTIEARAMLCTVANASSYGGGMLIAPDARIEDGLFDVCILAEASKLEFLAAFPRVFRGTHTTHRRVTMARASRVVIETESPLPVMVDGDVYGVTPCAFELVPSCVRLVAP